MTCSVALAEPRGLMAYGVCFPDMFCRAAVFVYKVLKGAKAGDLPIERWTKLDFIVNLKTVQTLGIKLPQHLL